MPQETIISTTSIETVQKRALVASEIKEKFGTLTFLIFDEKVFGKTINLKVPKEIIFGFKNLQDIMTVLDKKINFDFLSSDSVLYTSAVYEPPTSAEDTIKHAKPVIEGLPESIWFLTNIWFVSKDEEGVYFRTIRCQPLPSFSVYRTHELVSFLDTNKQFVENKSVQIPPSSLETLVKETLDNIDESQKMVEQVLRGSLVKNVQLEDHWGGGVGDRHSLEISVLCYFQHFPTPDTVSEGDDPNKPYIVVTLPVNGDYGYYDQADNGIEEAHQLATKLVDILIDDFHEAGKPMIEILLPNSHARVTDWVDAFDRPAPFFVKISISRKDNGPVTIDDIFNRETMNVLIQDVSGKWRLTMHSSLLCLEAEGGVMDGFLISPELEAKLKADPTPKG